MTTLATNWEQDYNSKPGPKFAVGSVQCMMTSEQVATCVGTITGGYLDGQQHGQELRISASGDEWMTLGS